MMDTPTQKPYWKSCSASKHMFKILYSTQEVENIQTKFENVKIKKGENFEENVFLFLTTIFSLFLYSPICAF